MRTIVFLFLLAVILFFVLFPLYWVIATSLKNTVDAFAYPPKWLFIPTLENFGTLAENARFARSYFNSFVISIAASVIAVMIGALAAYGLAQQDTEKRRNHEKFVLSLRIAPPLVFVIPLFYLATTLRITDTYGLIIGAYAFINIPFAISLLVTFFEEIPKDLRDAARVDGATELMVFFSVILPTAKGGVIATLIMCVLFTWNEFFIALVLTGANTQTLPVSVTSFLTFQGIQWGALMAAATAIMLPMIILGMLVQAQLVRGMTVGSVKG